MCGLHAAAKDRREKNAADRAAKYAEQKRIDQERIDRRRAGEDALAAVERVRALLDGAPMVPQAEVRRALNPAAQSPTPPTTDQRGANDE